MHLREEESGGESNFLRETVTFDSSPFLRSVSCSVPLKVRKLSVTQSSVRFLEMFRLFVLTFEQPCADGKIVSFLTGRSASSYSWAENLWAARGCSIVGTAVF